MKTPHIKTIGRSPLRLGLIFISMTFAFFALSPEARAACQEGCLTNKNTVLGDDALLNNTIGFNNIVIGVEALHDNTTGFSNTAIGAFALKSNTNGFLNTANGTGALYHNTGGSNNTAIGISALWDNTTGYNNTATGYGALTANTIGNNNTATGFWALNSNTTASSNTANGFEALLYNTTGRNNIALGHKAGLNLTTGHGNIDIGNPGVAGESSTIRIGRVGDQTATFIAGVSGATVPTGVTVIVDAEGRLGTTTSSARYKEAIEPMDKTSEAILTLKPVTFRYKHEVDPDGIPQFGLIAEEVAKVDPDLVVRDADGKPFTVRYEAVNAMLLNEFLKEHRKVEEQQATITELKSTVAQQQKDFQATAAQQQKQIEALTAGLQKVSAQVEMSRYAPQRLQHWCDRLGRIRARQHYHVAQLRCQRLSVALRAESPQPQLHYHAQGIREVEEGAQDERRRTRTRVDRSESMEVISKWSVRRSAVRSIAFHEKVRSSAPE